MEDLSHARCDAVFEGKLARNIELGLEPSSGISCYVQEAPARLERWRFHDEYELHFVVQTSGWTYIENLGKFKLGSIVLVSPRIPHELVSFDVPAVEVKECSVVIHFAEDLVHRAAELFPDLHGAVSLLGRDHCGIEFLDADQELHDGFCLVQNSSGVARFSALARLLQRLSQWPRFRPLSSTSILDTRNQRKTGVDPRVDKVLELVYRNYADSLPLSKASHCAGVSLHAFSRLFRRETGSTYTDFLIRVRVARACELLSRSDQQVSSICYLVGFNNISNFNRHFRRLKSMTPKEYRNHMAGRFGCPPQRAGR
ncbi:AraC family transcriptional regulator [Variovorax sp. ZS18.2.2]|uniref:AraC family transcriptional regulator n=1 Tax=Variovorax sp. ZS18.2.2 TaxID=2971255 RepID=UPI002150F98E|nr:AraC family transcriptional regulator [Variovorax sp. ZS18.2.2]MCR6477822.1 AraC family transcriptional regulator [Variovorax sp. ZS18.2.2]